MLRGRDQQEENAQENRTHARIVLDDLSSSVAAQCYDPAATRTLRRHLWMTTSGWKSIVTALRRGLRKRCPHCGEGQLFSGWSFFESCSVCGLVFARNPGDTWAFTILGDRLPIGVMIALIYFGVVRSHPVLGVTMLLVVAALAIWTTPNRWGVGIALHYLSRVYWPDPADPIPPPPATGP
ncbi:MAG TPA: hypothetical protein VM791_10320 [Vicinamibacterales bacterium]|nr:hypothetical protein [Vicinamibacterales bacterium]